MRSRYPMTKEQGGFRCDVCKKWYKHAKSARRHIATQHSTAIQTPHIVESDMEIDDDQPSTSSATLTRPAYRDENLELVYERNRDVIKTYVKEHKIMSLYNFETSAPDFSALMEDIFAKQKTAFKLNVEVGCVLWNEIEKNYSIFYASKNTALLDKPFLIENRSDLEQAVDKCKVQFERGPFMSVRPNTSYVFREVTNVLFRVFKLQEVPIGMPNQVEGEESVTSYIKKLRSVASFINRSDGVRYSDQLCFFRCLAGKLEGKYQNVDTRANALLDQWCAHTSLERSAFRGVKLSQISELEQCFEISIFVYTMKNIPGRGITAEFKRRSLQNYRNRLDLLLHEKHFSWIRKLNNFAKNFRCNCGTFFTKHFNYRRHVLTCDTDVKNIFPGGGYGSPSTVFQLLRDAGVEVEDEIYPYRIFYDFECRFDDSAPYTSAGGQLHYSKQLIPASFSIISNIPGQDPHGRVYSEVQFFANEDPKLLVDQFFEYTNDMAVQGGRFMREKYSSICTSLASKVEDGTMAKTQLKHSEEENERNGFNRIIAKCKPWEELNTKFSKWLSVVPILGFNSGRFDFALIRKYLIPAIFERGERINNVITKGNTYLSISLDHMQFLDIINYLAPGTNYQKFLTAYGSDDLGSKFKWPYSYFDSFDRLKETSLPPRSAFFSDLRQTNDVSEEEYLDLENEWQTRGWENLGDMLRFYNNQDCAPGLQAIENMSKLSAGFGIDMFKDAVSVPGVAMRLMFSRQGDTIYQVFDKNTKTWQKLIKESVVGGPSLVFTRYHEAGVTRIGIKEVKAILGYDANALYLYCTADEMPTGIGAEWTPTGDIGHEIPTSETPDYSPETAVQDNMTKRFQRKSTVRYQQEHVWVMYQFRKLAAISNMPLTIHHKYNGKQKTFYLPGGGKAWVDGWIPELNTVLEFQGCFYHGHVCHKNKPRQTKWVKIAEERRSRTQKRICGLKDLGLNVIEARECEVEKDCENDPEFQDLWEKHIYRPCNKAGDELVLMIKDGSLFGVLEVDIQVPWWKPELREYMKEMPPIFKNADVTLDDIGDVMKSHALEHNLSYSRRLLIGSYHATKMVFPTPVLKFYMELGLVITRIYKVLQFTPEKSFEFVERIVTENRRKADADPQYFALGETSKLYGNSCYGRCLMAVDKHTNTVFMTETKAAKTINSKWFRDCELISDDIYQVDTAKSKVTYELPVLIAFFVYGYAKVRILDFYYNFLLKVLNREDFNLQQMDTDSIYFAVTANDLESTVRPEKKELFDQLKPLFLPCTEAGTDKRTPGLFKLEWRGSRFVALNSKCYCGDGDDGGKKISCKGVNKSSNELTTDLYATTLMEKTNHMATNRGFRMREQSLHQYEQTKTALSWFYPKRIVQSDGIHTEPLDI